MPKIVETEFNKGVKPVMKQWAPAWAIHGSQGTQLYDLNTLVGMAFDADLEAEALAALGGPTGTSELSGAAGAFAFETIDGHDGKEERTLILLLTPDEFQRMSLRSLSRAEFRKLYDRYGIFFEIHDDFYDPLSGRALQPKR